MSDAHPIISCPFCEKPFAVANGSLQECPHCSEQFFIDTDNDPDDAAQDQEDRESFDRRFQDRNERLDNRQIKLIELEKRSLYRSRSWMLVIGLGLIGIAGQLVWRGIIQYMGAQATETATAQPPNPQRALAYFTVSVCLVAFSIRFFRSARRYLQQGRAITLPDPTTPPDFTTLRDGSQIVDGLRAMSDPDADGRDEPRAS